MSKSAAHCALAPSPSCITPFTFPKAVLEPLFVPTLPVSCEIPELLTAPFEEKRTKFAAVPKVGACPKLTLGSKNKISKMLEQYQSEKINPDWLNSIHSPIGLDIKSETVEEIAISIAAEIISVKNKYQ